MAPSRPSATTAAACTRMPTSRACGCCAVRVEHGHSIGRLAGLTDDGTAPPRRPAGASAAPADRSGRPASLDTAALTAALQSYDAVGDRPGDRAAGRGPPSARPAPGRADAGAGAGGRRVAPQARQHRAGAPDVLDGAEHPRLVPPTVRAARRARSGCSLRPPPATATRSARLARRCSRPAAAWASRISGRIFRHANCRERDAGRRPGAGAGIDHGVGRQGDGAGTSRDRPRSSDGCRAVGRRTRRRAPRRDHQPAGTDPSRLQRVPTGTRPPRRTRR